jgi:serine phosphatase RsbU (regulator of sigma subunit)/anti-sigma regulatory factor (Ser/Thr protein kinase)
MLERLGELRITAEIENVRTVSFFLHGIAQRLNLTEKSLFDVELAVEETVANIIQHAYRADHSGDIVVRVACNENHLQITLTDWGDVFKLDETLPYDLSDPIDLRASGGMGLHLISKLMDRVERTSTPLGEPNTLVLTKQIERRQSVSHAQGAERELQAMLSISRAMTTGIQIDQLLERIINTLVNVIETERGTIFLIDESRKELYSRVAMQDRDQPHEIRMPLNEGIAGQVATSGKLRNVDDVYSEPQFNPIVDQVTGFTTRNMLAAPIINSQNKIIGVVQLLNKHDDHFTSRDERLLSALAAQAGINIENARLHEQELQQRLFETELATARSIQTGFLPDVVPEHPGWEITHYWLPMREIGGDFYDFRMVPDGRLAIAIADVSGKGIPAAMFMAYCVTLIRFAMRLELGPAELFANVNRLMLEDQRSRVFATAFVGYLDLDSAAFQYASAGHNPPLLYRARTGTCEELTAPGVAMGVFEEAAYGQRVVKLEVNDVLVLYTDGITEVVNQHDEEFGEQRLQDLIAAHAGLSVQQLKAIIVETIADFGDQRGNDDETLIILKRIQN